MFKAKANQNIASVFTFVAAFSDRATAFTKEPPMPKVHSRYSETLAIVMNQKLFNGSIATNVAPVLKDLVKMKTMVVRVFQKHCENCLLNFRFHVLDCLKTKLEWFQNFKMFSISPFKPSNVYTKRIYCQTSDRVSTNMAETVEVVSRELGHGPAYNSLSTMQKITVCCRKSLFSEAAKYRKLSCP